MAENQLTEQEVKAFVGPKADFYLRSWQQALGGDGRATGFNRAALLLSGLWIPYRKMYRIAIIFFAVILLESLLEGFMARVLGMHVPATVGQIVALTAAVVCGVLGNQWYLSHARKVIAEVRARGLPEEEYLRVLSERGGTTLLGSLVAFALFLIVVFAVVALGL